MKKVNSALDGIRPSGTLLQQMFDNIGSAVSNFGASVARVVETALGVMLRDAIEFAIGQIRDLIQAIIEAGSEFQLLKIRLTGLNLNDLSQTTMRFGNAMAVAGQKTQEELTWLQTLGSATPFDPAQIANTYTQARAFGFAADEAKRLTTDIINYTAGMGLSNETLFLVIQNMGQMVQRGKITGTEIRDLARGSFLPLADVLDRIAKNMGITTKELTARISTPEGIPAQQFVKAFEQMVEEEPRFVGAAGRMSRALIPASQNVKELFTSIFGLNVATPIFDVLGEKVASLVDEFAFFNKEGDLVKTKKWEELVTAATNLGKAISDVVSDLLGFIPSSKNLTTNLISGIQGLSDWFTTNRTSIVQFFQNLGNSIQTYVVVPFERISGWVQENWATIIAFFQSLGDIVTQVFGDLLGGKFAGGDFLGGILDGLKAFMDFVIANKDQIAIWAERFIKVFIAVELVITAFNILIGIVAAVVGAVLGLLGALVGIVLTVTGVVAAISFLVANWVTLVATLGVVITVVGAVVTSIMTILTVKSVSDFIVRAFGPSISAAFATMRSNVTNAVNGIIATVTHTDWVGLGRSIIMGMVNGIVSAAGNLVNSVKDAVSAAYAAAQKLLIAQSPSKLFEELGVYTMQGFSQGIEAYAAVAASSMTSAMRQVVAPAFTMPAVISSVAQQAASVTNNSTNNSYSLAVNSAARVEPIISDFQMLQSLNG